MGAEELSAGISKRPPPILSCCLKAVPQLSAERLQSVERLVLLIRIDR